MIVGYLAPDVILTYFLTKHKPTQKLIEENNEKVVASALSIYEAIYCMTEKEIIDNVFKIKFVLNNIKVVDFKPVTGESTTPRKERINHLREIALRK